MLPTLLEIVKYVANYLFTCCNLNNSWLYFNIMVSRKILKNCKYYSSPPHLKNTYSGKVYVAKNILIQPHTTVNWIEPEGRLQHYWKDLWPHSSHSFEFMYMYGKSKGIEFFPFLYLVNLRAKSFDISNSDFWSRRMHSLKYLRSTTLGCKDIGTLVCGSSLI